MGANMPDARKAPHVPRQAKADAIDPAPTDDREQPAPLDADEMKLAASRQAKRASLEEDDDNPYQESDAALPDDLEEEVLDRDPSKEGARFDEV